MSGEEIAVLVPQIVAGAAVSAVAIPALLFSIGALSSKGRGGPFRRVSDALLGSVLIIGVPVALAALLSLLFLPLLLAIPLPLSAWAIASAFGLAWFIAAMRHPDGGHEGCTKLFMTGASAYLMCAAGWAIALADPPTGEVGSFIKPILLATPFAALGMEGRKGKPLRAMLFGAIAAFLLALGFVPIEQGFASGLLPESPWLKYPIGGAVALSMWVAVPKVLVLAWSRLFKVKIRKDDSLVMIGGLAAIGAALGLLYAGLTVLGL